MPTSFPRGAAPARPRPMRRYAWLGAISFYACSSSTSDPSLFSQPTRIRVSPAAFLGDTPCSDDGGMRTYQATLYDVTDGLEGAFALPSSDLVACTADVEFQYVEEGRYYIAEVRGFESPDLTTASPGAPVVVDDSGSVVSPRWTTTCWGQDGVTPDSLGLGGAGGDAMGGASGRPEDLGVRSFAKTIVTVRGCEPLADSGTDGMTRVTLSIENALVDLSCGEGDSEIAHFRLAATNEAPPSPGGAGGGDSGGLPHSTAACGQELVLSAEPNTIAAYEVEGVNQSGDVIWQTTCEARTREGITVAATCDPARAL